MVDIIYPLKMVIAHSYVNVYQRVSDLWDVMTPAGAKHENDNTRSRIHRDGSSTDPRLANRLPHRSTIFEHFESHWNIQEKIN